MHLQRQSTLPQLAHFSAGIMGVLTADTFYDEANHFFDISVHSTKHYYTVNMLIMTGIILYENFEAYHQWCKFFQFLS